MKTLTQRVFEEHVVDEPFKGVCAVRTDLVMCHEITTPPAILENQSKFGDVVFDPKRVVAMIDHVLPAKDSETALQGQVIRDWAGRKGVKFYEVGCGGVCHALLPEQGHVVPGMTIVCGDSHTCTHGAFGCLAVGVGTTDLQAALLKGIVLLKRPKVMRISVTGELEEPVCAKDLILRVIAQIGVKGATDHVIEFVGDTISSLSMDGRMTICNMAVEAGATSGVCYPDQITQAFLGAGELWGMRFNKYMATRSDLDGMEYDSSHQFGVSQLEPQITFGTNPGQVTSVGKLAADLNGVKINQVYVGSCTNGRLSDLRAAASLLSRRKIASWVRMIVVPATTQVQLEAIREGLAETFIKAGAYFSGPTCGACLGMSTGVLADGEMCVSTTNRNFPGRMGKGGKVFLASPATATASAIRGFVTDPREVL